MKSMREHLPLNDVVDFNAAPCTSVQGITAWNGFEFELVAVLHSKIGLRARARAA